MRTEAVKQRFGRADMTCPSPACLRIHTGAAASHRPHLIMLSTVSQLVWNRGRGGDRAVATGGIVMDAHGRSLFTAHSRACSNYSTVTHHHHHHATTLPPSPSPHHHPPSLSAQLPAHRVVGRSHGRSLCAHAHAYAYAHACPALTCAALTCAALTYAALTYAALTYAALTYAALTYAALTYAALTSVMWLVHVLDDDVV
ncbi:hypothetical protein VC83_04832 [Pseudogymnoascus destructans]|uniref:Uncharacterized protein n=1 Tax=Pseudogymnoascus destructans TaxID=655981 RepID=A0A177A6X2_9PEZI|nr:uncharacterized protein VC83_04832 [Pseudogymnoascus destructans]OAF57450.1 hypothetical protein VC83_04832 [Pseudogymnoascus destructans]